MRTDWLGTVVLWTMICCVLMLTQVHPVWSWALPVVLP